MYQLIIITVEMHQIFAAVLYENLNITLMFSFIYGGDIDVLRTRMF